MVQSKQLNSGFNLVNWFKRTWRQNIIYFGFIAVFIFFAVTLRDSGFTDPQNLLNIFRQSAIIAVMAVAMTLVLACGEIDLSVGAVAGLASVTTALALATGGLWMGLGVGIMTGVCVGIVNGLLSTRLAIPTFLTTLSMMGIAKGTAMWVSHTKAVPVLNQGYADFFGGGSLWGIPSLLIWMFVIGVLGHITIRFSKFGRQILAVGGNETAARYSGIRSDHIKMGVLVLSSTTAALAGMLYAGRLQSGRFQMGEGDELSVIAAAVLGGTSLFGGKGTVIGSIVGALMIGVINNGLILMSLEYSQQLIARGGIIILAVAISQMGRKKV